VSNPRGACDGGSHAQTQRPENALSLSRCALSLGDADTLVEHPVTMKHASYSAEERAEHGISDGLIRMSVGLEKY
jgi:methionine-gamma-lyase